MITAAAVANQRRICRCEAILCLCQADYNVRVCEDGLATTAKILSRCAATIAVAVRISREIAI